MKIALDCLIEIVCPLSNWDGKKTRFPIRTKLYKINECNCKYNTLCTGIGFVKLSYTKNLKYIEVEIFKDFRKIKNIKKRI